MKKKKRIRAKNTNGFYKIYVKCKKCKQSYVINVFGEDRKEWWEKNGKNFVCFLCDSDVLWYNKSGGVNK